MVLLEQQRRIILQSFINNIELGYYLIFFQGFINFIGDLFLILNRFNFVVKLRDEEVSLFKLNVCLILELEIIMFRVQNKKEISNGFFFCKFFVFYIDSLEM